jgi:hypothetical protein
VKIPIHWWIESWLDWYHYRVRSVLLPHCLILNILNRWQPFGDISRLWLS